MESTQFKKRSVEAVERAVKEAVAPIEEDGAEVFIFGCSDAFWLQSFLQKRLNEMGWEVPCGRGTAAPSY